MNKNILTILKEIPCFLSSFNTITIIENNNFSSIFTIIDPNRRDSIFMLYSKTEMRDIYYLELKDYIDKLTRDKKLLKIEQSSEFGDDLVDCNSHLRIILA